MKVYLGPNLSQAGPATNLTRSVATRARMFELRTSVFVSLRSLAMVTDSSGGKAYQDQNAMKKPNLQNGLVCANIVRNECTLEIELGQVAKL